MSQQVWVRPYNKETDKRLLVEWLYAQRHKNRFDPDLFTKEQVKIYTAFDADGIVGFIPVKVVYMAESLAFKPGLSPVTEAKALQAWQHMMVAKCYEGNVPDMFFVTFDETVQEFAGRYHWNPVVVPMLSLHVADLEPKKLEAPNGGTERSSEG